MKNIWIVGATSRIAIEMARIYAHKGNRLTLIGRDAKNLNRLKKDLLIRGANHVSTKSMTLPNSTQEVGGTSEPLDIIIIALGSMSNQKKWEQCPKYRKLEWDTNTAKVFDWCEWALNMFESQKRGTLAVMSSVASDRAKKSNYGYACSKAAIDFYLDGLRHRSPSPQIKIVTLKPGPTLSPMTVNVQNRSLNSPKKVASIFVENLKKRKEIIYAPNHWWLIMRIIQRIPNMIWKKLDL